MINTSDYLAAHGIAESSLSDDVKDGVKEVLRAAGTKALEQLGPILQAEARKRGIVIGTPSTDKNAQDDAVNAALDELSQKQASEKRTRKILIVSIAAVVVLALVATALIIRKRA